MARRDPTRVGDVHSGLVVIARIVAALLLALAVLALLTLALVFVGYTLVPDAAQGPFALLGLAVAEGGAMLAVLAMWRYVDRRPLASMGLAVYGRERLWLRGAAVGALMMG